MLVLSSFLLPLVRHSQAGGRRLLVVRNYVGLPTTNRAKDIDILAGSRDLSTWLLDIMRVCGELGIPCDVLPAAQDHVHTIAYLPGGSSIKVDLISGFVWRGVRWLDSDLVFREALSHSPGIWKPHPAHE